MNLPLRSMLALCAALLTASCGKSESPKAPSPSPAPAPAAAPAPNSGPAPAPSAPSVPAEATATAPAAGASPSAPPPPTSSVALPPGWYAVYSGPGASGNAEVRTYSPYAAFAIAPDQTIEPSIKATGWTAAFSGLVDIEEPGQYRFAADSEGGQVTLSVSDQAGGELGRGKASTPGKTETEWVKLPAGKIQLTIRFTQGAGGQTPASPRGARLRTLWEMERSSMGTGFHPEPIPTALVRAPKFGAPFASAGYAALQGRVLIGELGCAHCHEASNASTSVLTRTSPTLGEIGRRANPNWLKRWITNPHEVRPNTSMPDVIGDTEKDKADAEAIVHFLVAPYYDASHFKESVATEKDVLAKGRELYHIVGCIQCHGPIESSQAVFGETGQSVEVPKVKIPLPHGQLGGKWNPTELAAFLKDPLKSRPSGRMPSLALSDQEADLLATYLLSIWPDGGVSSSASFTVDPAKVEIGKAAFAARGCADCHDMGGNLPNVASTLKMPPLAALVGPASGRGCLDAASTVTPRYELSEPDRANIKAGIEASLRGTGITAPLDTEARTVAALNCKACHLKDGQGGVPSSLRPFLRTTIEVDLGDEARVPPHLNLAGWKLTTQWMREVFTEAGRARPYMATRMPQFGEANVGMMPAALGAIAGVWPDDDSADPKSTDELVVAGRQLVGDGGLNCISCHAFGRLPPAGAPGPNIAQFASRLRLDWWKTYALGPARQKPGTRMPAFFATGKSTKTDILDGDPGKQINAIWAYFNLGAFAPPPSGVQTGKGLSLSVGDRPRIFRTFMKDAGSRGIAVGFPVGTHFGFDAGASRLVDSWKGEFIDASGAWANRGGMPATGQGQVFWKAPDGPPLAFGPAAPSPWPSKPSDQATPSFKGYKLDAGGVPTFMYRVASIEVEETFTPAQGAIKRSFRISGVPPGSLIFFHAGAGTLSIEKLAGVQDAAATGDVVVVTPASGASTSEFAVTIKP